MKIKAKLPIAPADLIGFVGRRRMLRPAGLILKQGINRLPLKMLVRLAGRPMGAPSAGAAAARLTGTSVRENLSDGKVQFRTIAAAVKRYRLDVDGTFSDLTVEPEACGCEIEMPENSLPYTKTHPVQTSADLKKLTVPNPSKAGRMPVFIRTVKLLNKRFTLPTISGGSGPFTLAGELMSAQEACLQTITEPDFVHEVMEYCTAVCIRYLKALQSAGAEIILIGEPTGAILSPPAFREFSGYYIKRIVKALSCPVILHVCGDASHLIEEMCTVGADAISLDAPVDLPAIAPRVPKNILIVGNLDPVEVLQALSYKEVYEATRKLLISMRKYPNYICASGCDLPPDTPLENIEAMTRAIREFDE